MEYRDSSKREQVLAEELWLFYFNRYLLDRNLITQREYTKMTGKITEMLAKRNPRKI